MELNSTKSERNSVIKSYSKLLDPVNIILTLTVVAALFFLVLYSRANVSLTRQNEQLKQNAERALQAQVGDAVPPLESTDLEGRLVSINYATSQKHLLFIFTTHCPACLDQLPAWDRLAAQATSKDYVVRGISVDSLDDTKANFDSKYQHLNTILAPNKNFIRTYRVNSFPQAMIISNQGVVEWIHVGKLSEEQFKELITKVTAHKG